MNAGTRTPGPSTSICPTLTGKDATDRAIRPLSPRGERNGPTKRGVSRVPIFRPPPPARLTPFGRRGTGERCGTTRNGYVPESDMSHRVRAVSKRGGASAVSARRRSTHREFLLSSSSHCCLLESFLFAAPNSRARVHVRMRRAVLFHDVPCRCGGGKMQRDGASHIAKFFLSQVMRDIRK